MSTVEDKISALEAEIEEYRGMLATATSEERRVKLLDVIIITKKIELLLRKELTESGKF
jgi:hypothetical protein